MERGNLDLAQDHVAPRWRRFWGLELGLLVSCVGVGGTDSGFSDKDTAARVETRNAGQQHGTSQLAWGQA